MKIGFIGTGQITKAVVTGIVNSKLKVSKIFISERNKKISRILKFKSKKIKIIKNNQDIVDKSNWIFLAVTPNVGNKILNKLKFKQNKLIISFISTIDLTKLKKITGLKKILSELYHCLQFRYVKDQFQFTPLTIKLKDFLIIWDLQSKLIMRSCL